MDAETARGMATQLDTGSATQGGSPPVTISIPSRAPSRATRPRRRPFVRRLVTLGVVMSVALGGLWGTGQMGRAQGLFGPKVPVFPRTKAARISLATTVVSRGELASSKNVEVTNGVEGQSTIIRILPEGTRVKKGDLVCEIDSSLLNDRLTNQIITTRSAKAELDSAITSREVAEIAVREYLEGTYLQSIQSAQSDMILAESELSRARDRYQWTERMVAIKYVSDSQKLTDAQTAMKAEMAIDRAETSMKVLTNYTGRKTTISLEAQVRMAQVGELAKEAIYERERAKQKKLEDQIAKCRMEAPDDGMVVYAKDANRRAEASGPTIFEGATVRERQKIFTLPDVSRMRVDAKVSEADIAKVGIGQRARVRIDGLQGASMMGTVTLVQLLPDSNGNMDTGVKVYTARVAIDYSRPGLMPGMTAQVEILVGRADNALAVPIRSIVRSLDRDCVVVATPEGPALKPVRLGASNHKFVEVAEGLAEGEEVALAPETLIENTR